jgi:DNA-binding HTH domain-containing proteins
MPLDHQTELSQQELTLAIYDAVAAPERWADVADALQRTLFCDAVDFMLLDGNSGDQIVGQLSGDDPNSHRDYVEYYLPTDVRVPRMLAKAPLQVFDDGELITPDERRRSPFHNELLPRQGLEYTMGARLAVAAPFVGTIACGQRATRGPFQEEQRRRLALYLPHFQRAMSLRLTMWQMEARNQLLAGALDSVPSPVLILAPSGELLFCSVEAQAILNANDGLVLRRGRIETADRKAARSLTAMLRDVTSAMEGNAITSANTTVYVNRPSGRRPYRLAFHPIPRASTLWQETRRPAILVVIGTDSARHSTGRDELLRTLYNLTPAEAALATAFGKGVTLREYAERRAISVETVRFQMKQVLAKTECRRQTDLVRLLAES